MMLQILHELIDAVAVGKGISDNRRGELHDLLSRASEADALEAALGTTVEPAPAAADVPAPA
jgi:hypothetical protein